MELTIKNQEKKPLLSRTELTARIHFSEAMPARNDVADALAKKLGAKRELLIVAQMHPSFGESSAQVRARLYDSKDAMLKLERENLIAKNVKKESPAPQAEESPEQE